MIALTQTSMWWFSGVRYLDFLSIQLVKANRKCLRYKVYEVYYEMFYILNENCMEELSSLPRGKQAATLVICCLAVFPLPVQKLLRLSPSRQWLHRYKP